MSNEKTEVLLVDGKVYTVANGKIGKHLIYFDVVFNQQLAMIC